MTRTFLTSIGTAAALLGAACVGGTADPGAARAASTAPPAGYEKVSGLAKLPDFLPGLGTLYGGYQPPIRSRACSGSWPRGSSDPREPRPIPLAIGRQSRPGAW
jgi:hypothetical protein